MKTMLIFFNAVEPGGINTITSGIINGFQRLGHEVDYYHASNKGRLHRMDRDVVIGKRFLRLKGEQLAHGKYESILRYRHLVNNYYDCVIFIFPCPHKTRSSGGDDETWKELYKVDKPVFCIFHDNHWDRYYPWLTDVAEYISGCFYTVSNAANDSLLRFPAKHCTFLPVLLDTSNASLNKGKHLDNVVWLSQHKKWKGYYQFIKQCSKIKYPVYIYNIGIQYYDVKKKHPELWASTVNHDFYEDKIYNESSLVNYHALQRPDKISEVLDSAGCSIDLSGMIGGEQFKGQITCSMIEPMLHGCVSVTHESMLDRSFSLFYKRDDLIKVIKNEETIAEDINNIISDKRERNRVAKNAFEYVKKYHDSAAIIQKIFIPVYNMAVRGELETKEHILNKDYIHLIDIKETEEPLKSKRLNRKFVFVRPTKQDYRKNVKRVIEPEVIVSKTDNTINTEYITGKLITTSEYGVDYFEKGLEKGISLYKDYTWQPERSLKEAVAIIDKFKLKRGARILDYGCAKGFLVKAFRILTRFAYGCDISRYAVCTADNDVRAYLKLCTHGFPFKNMEFDLCIAKDVFEHMDVETIAQIIKDIKECSERLFVVVPLGNGSTFTVPEYNYDTTHKIAQRTGWWSNLFKACGCEIEWLSYAVGGIKDNWRQYEKGNGFFSLNLK